MKTMCLEIITPEKKVVYEGVEYISLPSRSGECGVLPHHTETVIALEAGNLLYRKLGAEENIRTNTGFADISHTKVTVLTEDFICAE